MTQDKTMLEIVIADDDVDDRMLIEDAFIESRLRNPITFVENGEELMERLNCTGKFSDRSPRNQPGLILLDLNMPRMDGREALSRIKQDPRLRRIPVVVLTTSKAEEDVFKTYDLGVSSFISKPVSFDGLVDVVKTLNHYWIEIVQLPTAREPAVA
ncbi:MAG: response regulator [Hyphomicrobiaceae bacterium]